MATASTTPSDVRRYVETGLTDTEIQSYIEDADDEALTFNDSGDFRSGELDRLVKFYAAYLIAFGDDSGEVKKRLEQGSRAVTLETDTEAGLQRLRERIRANDPSGKLLGGREATRDSSRHITMTPESESESESDS